MRYRLGSRTALGIAVAVGSALGATQAFAVPQLQLSSGGETTTVTDDGTNDIDDDAGAVLFNGDVGDFAVRAGAGLTKPAVGSARVPNIDLNSLVNNDDDVPQGPLTIAFTETDYQGDGTERTFRTDMGGTTRGEVDFEMYLNPSNDPFGMETSIAAFDGLTGTAQDAFAESDITTLTPDGAFSLTQVATVTHDSVDDTTSFDVQTTTAVPAPATLLLLGSGLLALSFVGRARS